MAQNAEIAVARGHASLLVDLGVKYPETAALKGSKEPFCFKNLERIKASAVILSRL
jgi:hypothetical protein